MLLSLLLLPAAIFLQDAPRPSPWLLRPTAIIQPDGTLLEGHEVLIQGDRIVKVGADLELPDGTRIAELSGVLSPGFVDAFAFLGPREDYRPVTSSLRTADARSLEAKDLDEDRLRVGVTSFHLMPRPTNVLSGWGSLWGSGQSEARVKQSRASLSLLPDRVADRRLGPDSLPGALEILQKELPVIPESTHFLNFIDTGEALQGWRSLQDDHAHHFVAMDGIFDFGGALANQLVGLPTAFSFLDARTAETWRRLKKANIQFAFGTAQGSPLTLRLAAMKLSRATKNPAFAMQSITTHAATLVGVSGIGVIAPGAYADLVLWSGHPLDATSRLKATMVSGMTVYRANPLEEK